MDFMPVMARMASTASIAVLFATPVFVTMSGYAPASEKALEAQRRLFGISVAAAMVFIVAQTLLMRSQFAQVAAVTGAEPGDIGSMFDYVLHSAQGHVWVARVALVSGILAWLIVNWTRFISRGEPLGREVSLVAGVVILLGVVTGHYSGEQLYLRVDHALHLLALSLWVGGIVPWMVFAIASRGESFEASGFLVTMRRFSLLAMGCVAVVVVSGVMLSYRFVDTQGDLLGTAWGQWLVIKVGLVGVALWIANAARRAMNTGLLDTERGSRQVALEVGVEGALLLAVIFAASAISFATPASHDVAQWWLPFRISMEAIWGDKALRYVALSSGSILFLASVGWFLAKRLRRKARIAIAWAMLASLSAAVTVWAAAVPAFPDSFRRSDVDYLAESIASGRALYDRHCQSCHGTGGRGDGPLANVLTKRLPADLSAPHTALHTAGDMYWWISRGIPQSGMPGFADVLSSQDRWDIVNFLRAFSQGFQARVISEEVVRNDAWLAAPDFNVSNAGNLRSWRGISPAMLLVGGREDDIAVLIDAFDQSREPMPVFWASANYVTTGLRGVYIPQAPEAVRSSYALLSKTIDYQGDKSEIAPLIDKALFLVDRHGYVRARWVSHPGEKSDFDVRKIRMAIERLRDDTRVPPPPNDHIH